MIHVPMSRQRRFILYLDPRLSAFLSMATVVVGNLWVTILLALFRVPFVYATGFLLGMLNLWAYSWLMKNLFVPYRFDRTQADLMRILKRNESYHSDR